MGGEGGKAANGAKLFKAKCATCHTCNEGGPNKQGPNLFGVIGRQSGQVYEQFTHQNLPHMFKICHTFSLINIFCAT